MAWAIIDTDKRDLYINRMWEKRSTAEWERAELLSGFPITSEWHKRLEVVPWESPSGIKMRKLGPRSENERPSPR